MNIFPRSYYPRICCCEISFIVAAGDVFEDHLDELGPGVQLPLADDRENDDVGPGPRSCRDSYKFWNEICKDLS